MGIISKATGRHGIPRQVRPLRRRYREVWNDGRATGQMRYLRLFAGDGGRPMPKDLKEQAELGFVQAETAEWEMRTMAAAETRSVSQDIVDAFHWGFVEGWNEQAVEHLGRTPDLPPAAT